MTAKVLLIVLLSAMLALVGCSSKPPSPNTATKQPARSGVYYKDDGPPTALPSELDRVPNAVPRDEPLHRFANRPYNVLGASYTPMTQFAPLNQRGIASWYGKKFHGQKTAIGETYDMFAMSAAHPTAPLPSFARVTNPRTQQSVIVRINDRGPFHANRIVDLSYAAAHRIGIAQAGSGEVQFELLLPPNFANLSQVASALPVVAPVVIPSPVTADSIKQQEYMGKRQFFVQLGAFGNFNNAQVFQARMTNELGANIIVRQVNELFRVQLGPFASELEAQQARATAQQRLVTGNSPLPITSETSSQ